MFPKLPRDSFGGGSGTQWEKIVHDFPESAPQVAIVAWLVSGGRAVVKLLPRKGDERFEDKEDGLGVWSLSSLSVST